jgi:hypothetical protein
LIPLACDDYVIGVIYVDNVLLTMEKKFPEIKPPLTPSPEGLNKIRLSLEFSK